MMNAHAPVVCPPLSGLSRRRDAIVLLLALSSVVLAPRMVSAQAVRVQPGTSSTTDADDASIATGQTGDLALSLGQAYDGSVWRRLTFGTAGTASAQVWTIQGIAGMTKLLVTPDSVALPANQSVNVAQINGVTTTMGNGASGTGVQRVTIASDSTGQVALAAGSATIGALTPNQSTNTAQIAGSTVVADPCQVNTPTYTPISITTATTTRIVAPTAAKRTYVCAFVLFSAGTDNVGVVEGTGGTCGTGTAGVIGGTTAANGLNLTAQTGLVYGSGDSAVFATAGTNVDLCLITSAAVVLAGHVKWVAQ